MVKHTVLVGTRSYRFWYNHDESQWETGYRTALFHGDYFDCALETMFFLRTELPTLNMITNMEKNES